MKSFFRLLSLLIIISLYSCTSENKIEGEITVSSHSIEIPGVGGSVQFTVNSNIDWSISVKGFSFEVTPNRGSANKSTVVTVSASKNSDKQSREAEITISGKGVSETVKITQQTGLISFDISQHVFGPEAEEISVKISSTEQWRVSTISEFPKWLLSVTPMSGTGDATLSINTTKTTSREDETYLLTIQTNSAKTSLKLTKKCYPNNPPTTPKLVAPKDNATEVLPYTYFDWEESKDADNDIVFYTLQYSKDKKNWIEQGLYSQPGVFTRVPLEAGVKYYWKIVAEDIYEARTESEIRSFTVTSKRGKYTDGEYAIYQQSSKPNPITLVFSGDGYTENMFEYNTGKFDKDINRAIEALFAIEPYKTYRDYFTIYKLAVYSEEEGISIKRPVRQIKKTKFEAMWENKDEYGNNSTLMECNMDVVDEMWAKIPGLNTDAAQTFAPFVIICNAEIRAGTVHSIPTDLTQPKFGGIEIKTVSVIPLGNASQSFESIVQHELGGHGFGMLSDEYAFTSMGTIPSDLKDFLSSYRDYGPLGWGWNLTFESAESLSPWGPFLAIQTYLDMGTGMFEGGMNYGYGVWRPSYDSCMRNNKPYYNVQGRWLIYKRIKYTAKESYSLADFIENDKETKFDLPPSSGSVVSNPLVMEPIVNDCKNHVVFTPSGRNKYNK